MNAPVPIEIRALDDASLAAWDAFVESCPEATFFHRAGWKRVIEESFGHRTHYLYALRDGRIRGVLPLVHVKSLLFGNALVSTAFCVFGGPAASDDAAREALDVRACALADHLGVDHLEYRRDVVDAKGWVTKADLYVIFRKAIDPDPEANLKAIPRKQRAMVRKGIKAGLASDIDADVERLHPIYADSVHRLGTPVFPKRYFRALVETFGDACEVLTVVGDGRPLASVLSFYFRDQVLPYYGGGVADARRLAANDFMYWEVMRRAGERGCRLFDYGRSKRGTGAFSFKKNWGFEPEPLAYTFRLRRGDAVPEINPLNPKYRLFIAAWKRLPLPLATWLGPHIVRGLG